MELQPLEHIINALTMALGSVQNDWPFAKIGINLESISARFDGVLRLIFLEQHLRDPGLARKACMMPASKSSTNSFVTCRFWSRIPLDLARKPCSPCMFEALPET